MSNTSGPIKTYQIDCDREVVLQGRSTFFVTIKRSTISEFADNGSLTPQNSLYVSLYPNSRTFENVGSYEISQTSIYGYEGRTTHEGFIDIDLTQDQY